MNRKSFWKFVFGAVLSLSISLSLFNPILSASNQDLPFIESSLISDGTSNTILFGDGTVRFVSECESWRDEPNWSTEKINGCLDSARELKNKFNNFRQGYQSVGDKIKRANKWTNKLDEEYERNYSRNNGNSKVLGFVRGNRGFRNAYQKGNSQLNQLGTALDREIRDLTDRANGRWSNSHRNKSLDKYKGVIYFAADFGCGLINADCFRPRSGFEILPFDF